MNRSGHYQGENLVFIVGCPRSGTTWLQRLVSHHRDVRTGTESYVFSTFVSPQLRAWRRGIRNARIVSARTGLGAYLTEEEFQSILHRYMMDLLRPLIGNLAPGEVFVEKTPNHALWLPEIVELLPRCRIIHIVRDARDTVASILATSKSWGGDWAPAHPREAARMWVKHVRAARQAAGQLGKARFYELKYENLFARPVELLLEAWRFVGIEASEQEATNAVRSVGTDEFEFPIGGELALISGPVARSPRGFFRKSSPGGWKEDSSLVEKFWVWRVARKTMSEVGYPWSFPF